MSQLIPGRILPPVSFRFTVTGCYDLRASFQQGISSFQVLRQKVCTLLSSSCLFHSSFVLRSSRLSVDLSLCFYKILAHTSLLMSLIVTICYTNHIPTFVSNTTLYNLQYGAGVAQSVYYLTTDWTTGRSGFDFRQRQKIFLYPLCPDRLWGPPSLMSNGYRGSFPQGKVGPLRDADHWPLSSTEVKNQYGLYLLSPLSPAWRVVGEI
jgi:hypothetical protein